jgi:hypothetical protein
LTIACHVVSHFYVGLSVQLIAERGERRKTSRQVTPDF